MTKVTALNFAEESNIVELCRTLQRIYQRHHTTTELLASGMRQFVQRNQLDHQLSDLQSSLDDYAEFQAFMDSVLSSRVKIRFTIEHFIECSRRVLPAVDAAASRGWDFDQQEWSDKHVAPRFAGLDPSSFVGSISKAMNMATVAQLAIENAKKAMSDGGAVRSPEVLLTVHGDPNFTFPFPPRQAFNVITSMVAHSMKQEMLLAAQEMRIHSGKMNPVTVLVSQCESNHDAVVRITDRGGGIKVGELESVTTCLYSVRKLDSLAFAEKDVDLKGWMKSAIRVPYACVLARVFGGDLTVASVDGDSTSTCFYAPTSGLDDVLI